jgi:hypothetical protein
MNCNNTGESTYQPLSPASSPASCAAVILTQSLPALSQGDRAHVSQRLARNYQSPYQMALVLAKITIYALKAKPLHVEKSLWIWEPPALILGAIPGGTKRGVTLQGRAFEEWLVLETAPVLVGSQRCFTSQK